MSDDQSSTTGSTGTLWDGLFPYEEPYSNQKSGIEQVYQTAVEYGYTAMEGAPGTGKTLIALTAGINAVRNPETHFERVVCITSVKQQQRAFEDDLERINEGIRDNASAVVNSTNLEAVPDAGPSVEKIQQSNIPLDGVESAIKPTPDQPTEGQLTPVDGLTLVGKADMCSYTQAGEIPRSQIYGACQNLRDPVKQAYSEAQSGEDRLRQLDDMAQRAEVSTGSATSTDEFGGTQAGEQPLRGGDEAGTEWTAPYTRRRPQTRNETLYCPFYAQFRKMIAGHDEDSSAPISPSGLLRADELLSEASEMGVCPHAAMYAALNDAEVVIANYYHVFDPQTVRAVTESLVAPETFLVVDEAHNLVSQVRDLLSDSISIRDLEEAKVNVNQALGILDTKSRAGMDLSGSLSRRDVSESEIQDFKQLTDELEAHFDQLIADNLPDDWESRPDRVANRGDTQEYRLEEPSGTLGDHLSRWLQEAGHEGAAADAARVGTELVEALGEIAETHDYDVMDMVADDVGQALSRWVNHGHREYFRQFQVERRDTDRTSEETDSDWQRQFDARLQLFNCIPRQPIADRLSQFGGGVLMSATLAPLDAFQQETGLDLLSSESSSVSGDSIHSKRPVTKLQYDMPFPVDNRKTVCLNLTSFTRDNRDGHATDEDPQNNSIRNLYAKVIIQTVKTTPGNTLVVLPSYAEANWAAEVLEMTSNVTVPVLLDEPSSNSDTEQLKQKFFQDGPKVLVTSAWGTLTEGIDYDGDRLLSTVLCGVPIQSMAGDRSDAIESAYRATFGNDRGYELAFKIPAVRKARQALGRTIRGFEERGVRILADQRYARNENIVDVRNHLPEAIQREMEVMDVSDLKQELDTFWTE